MNPRELRSIPAIDYKLSNTTGEVRYKARLSRFNVTVVPNQNTTMSEQTNLDNVVAALQVLSFNISDYLDENAGICKMAVVDIDISIEKVQSMRSEFRALHLSLEKLITAEEYEESYKAKYDSTINYIIEFIIGATEAKRQKRDVGDYDVKSDKISSDAKRVEDFKKNCETSNFLLLEVERMMDESDVVFSKCIDSDLPDEVVSQLMENLPKERSRVDTWSRKYEKLLEIIPQNYEDRGSILNLLRLSYNNLMKSKKKYERNLLQEYEIRELSKQKAFKPSMLSHQFRKIFRVSIIT